MLLQNVYEVKRKDRVVYRYNPPKDAVTAGVVERKYFDTLDEANAYAQMCNSTIREWRIERKHLKALTANSNIDDLVRSYKQSLSYKNLTERTREHYDYYLQCWNKSRLGGVPLMKAKLNTVVTPMCQRVYEEHAANSVSLANHSLALYRLIFNYGIRQGFVTHNPFTHVKPMRTKPRRVTWEREQVRAFLNTAYSRWDWRNVGLIVHMAYEWGQRLGDMRTLTWDTYNVDTGVLTLTQSKRRAKVTLPTSEGLQQVLKQQHRDFGHQQYVAPSRRKVHRQLVPYSIDIINDIGRTIMDAAGLPQNLWLMDLRRTAITEMVENGVPVTSVMAISGHATPQSLTPYIRHTLKGATVAQQMRGMTDLMENVT
jgi:integrase